MAIFDSFGKDTVLWFIILFLLLFWCGKCGNDDCCEGC